MLQYQASKQSLTSRLLLLMTVVVSGALLMGHPAKTNAQTMDELSPLPSQKQTNSTLDLKVNPSVVYLVLKPGQTVQHAVTLTYSGSVPVTVTPTLVEFASDNKTGTPLLLPSTSVDFVTLLEPSTNFGEELTIKPNSSTKFVLNIAPPTGTPQVELPLTILFSVKPSYTLSTGSATTQASAIIGSHFITAINSEEAFKPLSSAQIESSKFFDSFRGVSFKVLIKNEYQFSNTISGKVVIRNWLQKEVATYPLVKELVLGKSSRYARWELAENQEVDSKNDQFLYKPPFLLGPYTINVVLTNPNQTEEIVSKSQQNVLAAPFSISLAIGLAICTYVLFVVVRRVGFVAMRYPL